MSYEDLQRLGLSKAIDEYHKLLQAGLKGAEADEGDGPGGVLQALGSYVKWTLLRPLPIGFLLEKMAISLVNAWIILAFFIFHTSVITIPIGVCYLLAPPKMISMPVPIVMRGSFSLRIVPVSLSHALHTRIIAFLLFAISLWASHATIVFVSAKNRAAAEAEISTARLLESWYDDSNVDAAKPTNGGSISQHDSDVRSFVLLVAQLAQQYDDNHDPIVDYKQAVAWLIQLCPELDIPVSRELMAREFLSAKQALVDVQSVLGASIPS